MLFFPFFLNKYKRKLKKKLRDVRFRIKVNGENPFKGLNSFGFFLAYKLDLLIAEWKVYSLLVKIALKMCPLSSQ